MHKFINIFIDLTTADKNKNRQEKDMVIETVAEHTSYTIYTGIYVFSLHWLYYTTVL